MRLVALLMALLMLTAGCLGFGGDDADSDANDQLPDGDGDTNDTSEDNQNASTSEGDDHEHEPEPEAHWDNRTGEVEGTNLVVQSDGMAEEQIELPETTSTFEVNLTAEEGELDAELYPPECEEQDDEPGEDCSHSLSTYESGTETTQPDGGTATWSTEGPDPGTWTLRMWKADAGSSSVPYTLSFFYVDEHEPGPDHH